MTRDEAASAFGAGVKLGLARAHAINDAPGFDEWFAGYTAGNQPEGGIAMSERTPERDEPQDPSHYVGDKTQTDQGKETDAHKAQREAGKDSPDSDASSTGEGSDSNA